jgi:hypothetical protein
MARSAVALSTANVTWEIETYPGMWQAMIASQQTILNIARESGQSVAEYSWSMPWYEGRVLSARTDFDLDRMVSTSTTVGGLDDEKRIRAIQIVRSDTVSEPMPPIFRRR